MTNYSFKDMMKKIYKKASYLDRYGGSVVFTSAIILLVAGVITSFYIKKNIVKIRRDWINQRCRPEIMPFAGFINTPPGSSPVAETAKNFFNCSNMILKQIVGVLLKPFFYGQKLQGDIMNELGNMVDTHRKASSNLRSSSDSMTQNIFNRILNMMTPVVYMVVKIKDMFQKTAGVLTTSLLVFLGIYDTVRAMLGAFTELLIAALIILVAAIATAFLTLDFPLGIALTIIFVALAIPTAIIAYWIGKILKQTMPNAPTSTCFDEDTEIMTENGKEKIKNIKLGTKLNDGGIVTALFKLSICNEEMYEYNNVIVSGTHSIIMDSGKNIMVKDHPFSKKIKNYDKKFLYCLNTTTKCLQINNTNFVDWDDLDSEDIKILRMNISSKIKKKNVHKFVDNGFIGETLIRLFDGSKKPICKINIGDKLFYGERVLGIVQLNNKTYKYNIYGKKFVGGPNLQYIDNHLGNMKTSVGEKIKFDNKKFHLITNTKIFDIDGVKFYDYNGAIETKLEGNYILFANV